ncbi:MAG: hypothetical protein H0X62_07620, partial [Bacteroidetes bacterium]|nr:hypothetical protein [Bacteroidota bacterium]
MKKFLLSLSIFQLWICTGFGQDIGVFQALAPSAGCELGQSETVTVQVFNYGNAFTGSFDVSYRLNGGPIVTETINMPFSFLQNSTYTYTFLTNANLSTFGTHAFDFFTTLAGDVNNFNDSVVGYMVDSDQLSEGGLITTPETTVCYGSNSGLLTLTSQIGNVLNWGFSLNGGVSWTNIATSSLNLTFSNLVNETFYRVNVKNGLCPAINSNPIQLSLDQPTVGGFLSGSDTVCFGMNSGILELASYTGDIIEWEYSVD